MPWRQVRDQAVETVTSGRFPSCVPQGAVVSGVSPIKTEFNPVPLMRKLADAGASSRAARCRGARLAADMRAWKFGDEMASGVWGIREPKPEATGVFPYILLVPLAAFDRSGQRIGYGAGHYDRTIARLREMKRVTAIGVCFRGAGDRTGSCDRVRPAARSRANGKRSDPFPEPKAANSISIPAMPLRAGRVPHQASGARGAVDAGRFSAPNGDAKGDQ